MCPSLKWRYKVYSGVQCELNTAEFTHFTRIPKIRSEVKATIKTWYSPFICAKMLENFLVFCLRRVWSIQPFSLMFFFIAFHIQMRPHVIVFQRSSIYIYIHTGWVKKVWFAAPGAKLYLFFANLLNFVFFSIWRIHWPIYGWLDM